MLYYEFNMEDALAARYAEGVKKERSYMARSMLLEGEPVDKIVKYTKLSEKEVLALK